jgi:hypothetical protein
MAIVREFYDQDEISIPEFIDAAREINLDDEQAILTLAPQLHRLANNKSLIESFIIEGLKDISGFQANNSYSAQTYILTHITQRSFLRFAIWSPLGYFSELDEGRYFNYDIAHDHNFSLLTAGIFGNGYTTTVYQREPGKHFEGVVGETLHLTEPQFLQLSPGKVILYEAHKDIHVQHPPNDLSVSLNFMVDQRQTNGRQLYYDVVNKKVTGYMESANVTRGEFFKLAALLNDEACNAVMTDIAEGHGCDFTRIHAHLALAQQGNPERVKEMMLRNSSMLVRSSADMVAHTREFNAPRYTPT